MILALLIHRIIRKLNIIMRKVKYKNQNNKDEDTNLNTAENKNMASL